MSWQCGLFCERLSVSPEVCPLSWELVRGSQWVRPNRQGSLHACMQCDEW